MSRENWEISLAARVAGVWTERFILRHVAEATRKARRTLGRAALALNYGSVVDVRCYAVISAVRFASVMTGENSVEPAATVRSTSVGLSPSAQTVAL